MEPLKLGTNLNKGSLNFCQLTSNEIDANVGIVHELQHALSADLKLNLLFCMGSDLLVNVC